MPDQTREKAFAEILFRRLPVDPEDFTMGEKPDARFHLNGISVGMEITESTPEEVYRGASIIQELSIDPLNPIIYSPTNLRNHGIRRSKSELLHDMINNPTWIDMEEHFLEWRDQVQTQWDRKLSKLVSGTYELFDENWLLIWDNEGLSNDSVTAATIPKIILSTKWPTSPIRIFDRVFVISGDYTFISEGDRWRFMHLYADDLNDILGGSSR